MIQIVACDDDLRQLKALKELLAKYRDPDGESVKYELFNNASELLDAMNHTSFDLAILDILMPGLTGMEAAKEIRTRNRSVRLVFLTSSREFAVESYRVRAYDYLLKPVDRDLLYAMLDRVFSESDKKEEALHISTSKNVLSIPFSKIEFVEINNRTLTFNLIDKTKEQITGKLSDYEAEFLNQPGFIKPHRSFIVNMDYIKTLGSRDIEMRSGNMIPIARGSGKEIKDSYMGYMFD